MYILMEYDHKTVYNLSSVYIYIYIYIYSHNTLTTCFENSHDQHQKETLCQLVIRC